MRMYACGLCRGAPHDLPPVPCSLLRPPPSLYLYARISSSLQARAYTQ